jgi:hypothetical protein
MRRITKTLSVGKLARFRAKRVFLDSRLSRFVQNFAQKLLHFGANRLFFLGTLCAYASCLAPFGHVRVDKEPNGCKTKNKGKEFNEID